MEERTHLFYIGEPTATMADTIASDCPVECGANPYSIRGLKRIIEAADSSFFFICTGTTLPKLGYLALSRLLHVANDTGAGMLYSDFWENANGISNPHPLNDYQAGSLRDDFDFGPLILINTTAAKKAVSTLLPQLQAGALYDLRLTISREWPIVHLNEKLVTLPEKGENDQETKQFAYVDPKNRSVQLEMEAVCTNHLKAIGAWLPPVFEALNVHEGSFPVEASVIIPVRNRERTICDAIDSVLHQATEFPFNVVIIDNHSTDNTTSLIASKAKQDSRIIHLTPERTDLGIGGCWNVAVQHPSCGRFAVQLDSDDVYSDENTLTRIVNAFYDQQCGMLVGSYRICNFNLETIPPGIIDHREWTEENGRNNALRVNGLGAPRAFFTPLLRSIHVPNISYGEDYALGLRFSRQWKIGRIYDVLYLCRRWEDNSDAAIDLTKMNAFNHYKDQLRTIEISARQRLHASQSNK